MLVAVVGISLLIFILQAALESGNTLFSSSDRYVGEIAGEKIPVQDYNMKVEKDIEDFKANSQQGTVDEQTTDMLQKQTWDRLVNDIVMGREYRALGLTVTEDELVEAMLGEEPHFGMTQYFTDRNTGKIYDQYADPRTGKLNMVAVRKYHEGIGENPDVEKSWIQLEKYVRETKLVEKYNNLIKKGLYTTTSQAKKEFAAENTKIDIRYVAKRYNAIPDSTIQVTESDIMKYYNEHQYEFKVPETTRKAEYISFDAVPSDEDIAAIRQDLEKLKEELKTTTEDSLFVVRESDTRTFDNAFVTKDALSPMTDTLFNAPVGTVVGPYMENNAMKISKLVKVKTSADSAHVRHILIAYAGAPQSQATRSKEQAKALADSLQAALKGGKAKFTEMVTKFSDDGGKNSPEVGKGKDGDYGWLNSRSQFVPEFIDGGLDNPQGSIVIKESMFGYHIMEVLESKGQGKKVSIATVERVVEPSPKTMQAFYQKASDFSDKYNTPELFNKGVEELGLTKRIADNIKEADRNVAGLESPRPLIKWMYEAEPGQVSDPFEFGNKFVVATLVSVKEKGIAPLETVKEEAKIGAIREKKAEKFMSEINAAMAGAKTVDDIAAKLKEQAMDANDVGFAMYSIPGLGNEGAVLGTVSAMKPNTLSKPIKGNTGVFVVMVKNVEAAPAPKDYNEQKKKGSTNTAMRVDYEVTEALKEKADIKDNRMKFNY